MPGIGQNWGVPLPNTRWPQDTLQIPSGYGRLTPIEVVNQQKTKREYYGLAGSVLGIGYGQSRVLNIPVGDDGDFWVVNFTALAYNAATNVIANGVVADLTMRDVVTGHEFYTPSIPLADLRRADGGFKQNWMEPYCVIRQGALIINITMATSASATTFNVYLNIDGWKEYRNASQ